MIFLKKNEIVPGYNEYTFLKKDMDIQIEELISDIDAYLDIELSLSRVIVKGNLTYRLKLQCSRCAEEFESIIKENAELIISEETMLEGFITEKELRNYTERSIIDLSQWLYDTILLSIPTKVLCYEDCKGLCPICGTNLNLYTCNCKTDNNEIDPRWQPLLKIMKKGGK